MKISFAVRIAFRSLWRNKMRSTLTALGIIIGVGAVIAMVSIGNGARTQVEDQIASLGQNVVVIFSGSRSAGGVRSGMGGAGTLSLEDAEAIQREIPQIINLSPEVSKSAQVIAEGQNWYTRVQGESPDYFAIRQWAFEEGQSFTEQDVRSAAKVAVIGATIRKQLFGSENPVGKIIRVNNVPFTVVGLLEKKGLSVMGMDQDDALIIPYTSVMKRITNETNLRAILAQVGEPQDMAPAQKSIENLLKQRHRITDDKPDDFTVHNQEEITKTATETSRIMTVLLGAIAGVSLVVGGIGIMNIMLVSVTERTREIGIRMAVGARQHDILLQFLIEAIALSAIGGIIGIATGIATSEIISAVAKWPTLISMDSILLALICSGAVGIFFGYYPARKASRLQPIDALRYE
ncbi:MAG: ABC transporter permease [Verrucomicrobiota bacterium]